MEPKKFNDLNREFLEDFIAKLSKEDKKRLKEYIIEHPRNSSSGMFAMIKSYIYNTYFRAPAASGNHTKESTFADTIETLLMDVEEDEENS